MFCHVETVRYSVTCIDVQAEQIISQILSSSSYSHRYWSSQQEAEIALRIS